MKNVLLALLFCAFAGHVLAQELVFQTLASKGTCMVQRGVDPDEYVNLKTGVKLFTDDKIIITGDNSYLGLVSTSGEAIELVKGGVYDVNKLNSSLTASNSSVAGKYVAFLVEDMSKANESTNANMKFTGSVERSLGNESIELFIPKDSKVSSELATLKWYPKEEQTAYILTISNMFDEVVYSTQTKEKEVDVDFGDLSLTPDETYKVIVAGAANPAAKSEVASLYVPEESQLNEVEKGVSEIEADTPEGSAIQEMVLAKFYDENELYLNAIPHFQKAIALQPEVEAYQDAYNAFLYRVGLQPN